MAITHQSISHPITIVDLGAYIGKTVLKFNEKFPNSVIHAVEADPVNYAQLKKATSILFNVKYHNLAISDNTGYETFYTAVHGGDKGATSQANSLFKDQIDAKPWAKDKKKIKIMSMTLDTFCDNNGIGKIDLLKINIEGGEYKIFESETMEFLYITNQIMLDLHLGNSLFESPAYAEKRKNIKETLERHGFKLKKQDLSKHIRQVWVKK